MTERFADLRDALSANARLATSDGERALYARDCWPYLNLNARAGRPALLPPDVVVYPDGEADVIAAVRWCVANRVPIVPVGGGSGVAGGTVPMRGGVAIDVKSLDTLDTSQAEWGVIRVGAGWVGARLEHELNQRGLTLGHFPSSILCSTLGGYVATRSAGQLSSRHGKIEDLVLSVRYVDGNGDVRETSRGRWDSTQVIVGSEGTLGVILDATLRVEPAPVHRRYRGYSCASVHDGLDVIRSILQAGLRPAVLRLYDEFDTYISGARKAGRDPREKSGITQRLESWIDQHVDTVDVRQRAIRAGNALLGRSMGAPMVLNRLADKVYDACLLIVGVEEADAEMADAHAADVFEIAGARLTDLGEAPGNHWYEHRYAVSYKMSPLVEAGMFVDTMEVATSWSNLEPLYHAVKSAMSNHVFVMAHFSHAYTSGGSIYFTFAGFAPDHERCIERYRETWLAAMKAVSDAGAAITHHHGVGLMKAPRLEDDHRGGGPLFERAKTLADPNDVLNPEKLWHTRRAFP